MVRTTSNGRSSSLTSSSPAQLAALSAFESNQRPPHDTESLSHDLQEWKEKYARIERENVILRSQSQRLVASLHKKDKQMQQLIALKVTHLHEQGAPARLLGQLQGIKNDILSTSMLVQRISEMEEERVKLEKEVRTLKESLKFTVIKELEIENQTYLNEITALRLTIQQLITRQRDDERFMSMPFDSPMNESGGGGADHSSSSSFASPTNIVVHDADAVDESGGEQWQYQQQQYQQQQHDQQPSQSSGRRPPTAQSHAQRTQSLSNAARRGASPSRPGSSGIGNGKRPGSAHSERRYRLN